jgi:hypothetical protein
MASLMDYEQSREREAARQAEELAAYLSNLMNQVAGMRKANQQENQASRTSWLRGPVVVESGVTRQVVLG